MAIMMGKLYAALRDANVPEDRAREAAEEAASFENRLAGVEARLMVLTWMTGFNLAMTAAIMARLFVIPHS